MARRISEHTAITGANIADTDLWETVDVSDPTDAATGTNKRTTTADVRDALLGAGAAGGAPNVAARLHVISGFASPNGGGIVSGHYYDNAFQGTNSAVAAAAVNRMELAPYYTSEPFTIDQIGVSVSTGVASAQVKILIYACGSDGWPAALLYESAPLSAASVAFVSAALAFTFDSATIYWVGVRHSSTASIHSINVSSAVNLGMGNAGNAANYRTVLRRTLTFATAAPNPWGFVATELTNASPPSVRMRAA